MGEQGEGRSESWVAWITLLLAALAWLCVIIVCATKGLVRTWSAYLGWTARRPGLELPMLLASPVYATLGAIGYVILRWRGHDSVKNQVGFALVAFWLLGFLGFVIAHPVFRGTGEPVLRAQCLSNLKQLGLACHVYAEDNKCRFPPDLGALYHKYAPDALLFVCPEVSKHFKPTDKATPDRIGGEPLTYCYVSGVKSTDEGNYMLSFDEEWNHEGEGVNVLHVDGHVRWVPDVPLVHEKLRRQAQQLKKEGREVRIIRPSWSRHPDRPAYTWPPWYIGWAGAFACVAVGFVIPAGGLLLWEHLRLRRRT